MPRLRSWLFVPANRVDRIAKAFASDADAVVMDLEDACPADRKEAARDAVVEAASTHGGPRCFVRINGAPSLLSTADLDAVVVGGVAGIVLPKAETAAGIAMVDERITAAEGRLGLPPGGIELLPLVETATGVLDLPAIARSGVRRVRRLTFGAGDLTVDLGMRWTDDEAELALVRQSLVLASRAAGLEPPIDTVWPRIADREGFRRSLGRARDLGFGGKLLIHPDQVGPTNEALAPSAEEVELARRVLAAARDAEAAGQGAFRLDGRLMDHVSVVRARRTLAEIEETGS